MAADTAQKRYSAYDLACPWRGIRVLPSGTVDAAARTAALNLYSGITGVAGTAPTVTTTELDDAEAEVAYSATLAATGDTPITWAVSAGSLPPGWTLSSGGVLSGTCNVYGLYSFTVEATNAVGSDTQALTVRVMQHIPVDWQGRRRKRTLAEQPNLHLDRILDEVIAEHYRDLTEDDVPQEVQKQAAAIVKPFAEKSVRRSAIPPPSRIDWEAMKRDTAQARRLMELWQRYMYEAMIEDEDEQLLLLN